MGTFSAKVAAMTKKYQMQMRVVAKESAQKTVSMAQRIDEEGGTMRVDTGFLRASLAADFGKMPSGTSENPYTEKNSVTFEGQAIAAAIIRWNPGVETLFVGWTANYARPREYRDGFLRLAVQQWDQTVKLAAIRVKASL